jgi:aldose 1-epimerase
MAPWVNRIADGRCAWRGRDIDLTAGPAGGPQGLHGIAWRLPWGVRSRSAREAELELAWNGGAGWPFAFRLARRFELSSEALIIEAVLSNAGAAPMPFALGFHPYFPAAGAVVTASTRAGWVTDASGIPVDLALQDVADRMRAGVTIAQERLDTCFAGWNGTARIAWPTHALDITTRPALGYLQVYAPAGAGYFCLEPQSAMPDAFNRDAATGGVGVLDAGQAYSVTLLLRLAPRSPA